MKKRFAVVLVLAFSAAAAFAQDGPVVRISGLLQTGIQDVVAIAPAGVTDEVSLYDFASGTPSRLRLVLSLSSSDGDWGITTRLDIGTNPVVLPLYPALNQALVWGNLLDRLLTLKAGILDEEAFSFTWRPWGKEIIWGGQIDGEVGLEALVRPLPGLEVAYVFPVADQTSLVDSLRGSTIGAAYTMEKLVHVVAGAQLTRQVDITLGVTTAVSFAWAAVEVTAVPDLTARVAALASSIGSAYPWIEVYQEAGYAFGDLGLSLKAWEEAYSLAGSSLAWQAEPAVSYTIGSVTVGMEGDLGTLLLKDPNPGVASLPFGLAAGALVSFAASPNTLMQLGGRFIMPDITVSSSTVQIFLSFVWSF